MPGVYVLNGFMEQQRVPVMFPKDILFFKHEFGSIEVWYVATLQSTRINQNKIDYLVIYRYKVNHIFLMYYVFIILIF